MNSYMMFTSFLYICLYLVENDAFLHLVLREITYFKKNKIYYNGT